MAKLLIRIESGDFEKLGFLGDEIQTLLPKVRSKYKDTFGFFYELNELSQKQRAAINRSRDEQQRFAIALFARILDGAQAAYLLLNYGLCVEARTILRSILEALFLLRRTVQEPKFVKKFIDADDWKRLKGLKKYADDKLDQGLADSIKNRIKDQGLAKLEHVKVLAESAGLSVHYEALYRRLSEDVHVSLHSLQRPAFPSGDGLDWGPRFSHVSHDLLMGSDILLRALWLMDGLFKMKIETELREFRKRLTAMVPKYFAVG